MPIQIHDNNRLKRNQHILRNLRLLRSGLLRKIRLL